MNTLENKTEINNNTQRYTARTKESAIIQHILKNLKSQTRSDISISVNFEKSNPFYISDDFNGQIPLFLPPGGAITGEFLSSGQYEATSIKVISSIINSFYKDFVFVDVGANIGLISRQILNFSPAEMYCYEANPNVFNYLKRNLNIQSDFIHLFNGALWKDDSETDSKLI